MCTAFVHRGRDVIFGFNLDINEGAFPWVLHAGPDWFGVGCPADLTAMGGQPVPAFYRVTDGLRKIHGVSSRGVFTACLNNMGCCKAPFRLAEDACSIDQLMDDLLSGSRSLEDVRRFAEEKQIVTLPGGAVGVPDPGFHSLSADAQGHILLLEPGNGYAVIRERYAALTNFPHLELLPDMTDATAARYGRDRYDRALGMLRAAGSDLTPAGALRILEATKQTGTWATRVSFVYSCNERVVRYCLEGDFGDVRLHRFG